MLTIEFNKPIPIKCGLCSGKMEKILTKDKAEYWKCNECGAETWPPEKDDTPEKFAKAARKVYKEFSYDNMKAKRGSGSGSNVKARGKKKLNPLPASQRYRLE